MANACWVGGLHHHGRRSDHDKISGDRDQVVEGPGRQQLVEPFVVLLAGEPTLRVRGAQDGGHLLPIGIGGPEISPSDGTDIAGLGNAFAHSPTLISRRLRGEPRAAGPGLLRDISGPNP